MNRLKYIGFLSGLILVLFASCQREVKEIRQDINLNEGWVTVMNDSSKTAYAGFEKLNFSTDGWQAVNVPHNWDDYGGYRRLVHGNLHGYAWYKKTFSVDATKNENDRYFLYFEGVGSYATVWVNGIKVGTHAGGRTTFTLDATKAIKPGAENELAVRADHPANIRDLPWVCGGCSPEWGFSEGSQPLGIFRPVHLIITNNVRVEPFGVHVWNDPSTNKESALLNITVEVKNYGKEAKNIEVQNYILDADEKEVARVQQDVSVTPSNIDTLQLQFPEIKKPNLWSTKNPYLYTVVTDILENGKVIDRLKTRYGIRWIKWDIFGENPTNRFYLNDEPVFINGTAEYEHLTGQSHAFSDEQVKARVEQMMAMGFNSFRDAHQPHNFRYHEAWDSLGILWWTQMAAHIWFDNPEFKKNFKTLLHDWVKERRNSPSIILWGLENESTLPTGFAEECSEMIREMDPTTSSQRLVTTCNGGTGTDWDVIQNWSGTYGGNPDIYDEELSKQLLNGEYGAWRSIDFHTGGEADPEGEWSEERMTLLMEKKVRLAEKASDRVCGQYHWLFNSHDNPGRTQSGEGMRDLDRLGPINYKGAVTNWGEPLDVFYMFRSNYISSKTEPMVYIVSHTWPDRWVAPGVKNGVHIYSNCDEVELFNGVKKNSLGKKKKGGIGTHFVFHSVDIKTNILTAIGYVGGKEVVSDLVMLHHLPNDPDLEYLQGIVKPLQEDHKNRNTIYRVNCGGPDYTDSEGNLWMADVQKTKENAWGSQSWTDDYEDLPAFYGSQRQTYDPIRGTDAWPLLQTFRYGRHKLNYQFPVPDGKYKVELYFIEPWYGTGGSLDCKGWRIFDVAINDKVVLDDLDIWAEADHDKMLKKTVEVNVKGGLLKISFPEVKSGQAVISAIAISTTDKEVKPAPSSQKLLSNLNVKMPVASAWKLKTWLNTGDSPYFEDSSTIVKLPSVLYGAEWLKTTPIISVPENEIASFVVNEDADVYIGLDTLQAMPKWISDYTDIERELQMVTNGKVSTFRIFQKKYKKGETVHLKALLPGEVQNMYFVVAVPVSNLDKSIDLRSSVRYEAEDGELIGKAKITTFKDKKVVMVPGTQGGIGFKFEVGLASKYGLEFRFMSMTEEPVVADVEIRAADDRLMWAGKWTFLPANIKWQSLRTDTQTTINAGKYTISIKPEKDVTFYFDWLKVK